MSLLAELGAAGADVKDDGVYGPELVRAGVAGTGHVAMPVEEYLRAQLKKEPSNQSVRATARGLRELYRLLGFIEDSGQRVSVTALGRQAANLAEDPLGDEQIRFWRDAVRNLEHVDGEGRASHPYQVLLRLVARKPGITRAKCALALEARDDSADELGRIVRLVDLPEEEIRRVIGVSKSNWDNAKKVLPKFAEQLGDVVRNGQSYFLAAAPGEAQQEVRPPAVGAPRRVAPRPDGERQRRAPRTAREVTLQTVAAARTLEQFDESADRPAVDPLVQLNAIRVRHERFDRHQATVRELARRLAALDATLFEGVFDLLALFDTEGLLAEVKTLDGSPEDERERVREALAQLLYYEAFATAPDVGETPIHKVACFEHRISDEHQLWLNRSGIAAIWRAGEGRFGGDGLARRLLGGYLEELR